MIQKQQLELTKEQVQQDIQNVVNVLQALDKVIPEHLDNALIEALQGISTNPYLLGLLTAALSKI